MDHIPLEIHMGLEIKGKWPDKMHCILLRTKCLNNGLNLFFFWPNPQGYGFVLWVFSKIFWALRLLGFENCVTCQGWLLPPLLMCLASHHAHEGDVIREKQILKEWKKWGQEQEVIGVFSLPLWLFRFSLFFSSFPFTLSSLHFFLILSLFPFSFFSHSLKAEGWVKIRILIREIL